MPNAVELLTSLHHLAIHPGFCDKAENCGLIALGLFTGFLVGPYTDTSMSLTNQLTSLAAAAHLLFVLYRQNRTSFCPGQFYYDVQSLIKSAYWSVAKQQLLDPTSNFYIIQNGSDQLENNFGIY